MATLCKSRLLPVPMCEGVSSFNISQGFVDFEILFALDLQLSSFNGVFGKRQLYISSQLSEMTVRKQVIIYISSLM